MLKRHVWLMSQWPEEKRNFLMAAFLANVTKYLHADKNQQVSL